MFNDVYNVACVTSATTILFLGGHRVVLSDTTGKLNNNKKLAETNF